jgi:uncharacterized surface anchored protein
MCHRAFIFSILLLSFIIVPSQKKTDSQSEPRQSQDSIPSYQQDQAKGTIVGVVKDPQGAILAGAQVTAINKKTGKRTGTQTDSDGKFVLTDLAPGEYRIEVEATHFARFTVDSIDLRTGDLTSLGITFGEPVTESVAGKIKGTVNNESNGFPIQGAKITITQLSNNKTYETSTDSHGKYEKAGLLPDKYKVRAEASGFIPSKKEVELKSREVKVQDFELRLRN